MFIDTDCKIEHEGKIFESGGAFILTNTKTEKMGGMVYGYEEEKKVGNWDGSLKIPAHYGRIYESNFLGNRRRHVWFKYDGKNFFGVCYSVDWDQRYQVREVK
jgi:hypothetical protein